MTKQKGQIFYTSIQEKHLILSNLLMPNAKNNYDIKSIVKNTLNEPIFRCAAIDAYCQINKNKAILLLQEIIEDTENPDEIRTIALQWLKSYHAAKGKEKARATRGGHNNSQKLSDFKRGTVKKNEKYQPIHPRVNWIDQLDD